MTPSSVAGAHCGNHPAVAAVEICSRCGTFLCGECVEYFKETTPACSNCLPALEGGPASTRARISPLLSLVGLAGLVAGFLVRGRPALVIWAMSFLLGFSGIAFGVQELRLIRAAQAGKKGRIWALVGVAVGTLFALLFAAIVVNFVSFIWLRARGTTD